MTATSQQAFSLGHRTTPRRVLVYGLLAPVVAVTSGIVAFLAAERLGRLLGLDGVGLVNLFRSMARPETLADALRLQASYLLNHVIQSVAAVLFGWFVFVRPRGERLRVVSLCVWGALGYVSGFVIGCGVAMLSAILSPNLVPIPLPLFAFSGFALGLTRAMGSSQYARTRSIVAALIAGLAVGSLEAIALASNARPEVGASILPFEDLVVVVLAGGVMAPGSLRSVPPVTEPQSSSGSALNLTDAE